MKKPEVTLENDLILHLNSQFILISTFVRENKFVWKLKLRNLIDLNILDYRIEESGFDFSSFLCDPFITRNWLVNKLKTRNMIVEQYLRVLRPEPEHSSYR